MMTTRDSRSALARARFFLSLAQTASVEQRTEFEAFLEAAIVSGRTAVHRFQAQHKRHPDWKRWWDSLRKDATMNFFEEQRNWILKEGPLTIGQNLSLPSIGPGGAHIPAATVSRAASLYFFDDPNVSATETVERLLITLEQILTRASLLFN